MRLIVHRALESQIICGVIGVVGLLCATEAAGRFGLIPEVQFPLASTVLANAVTLATDAEFLADVGATFLAWALGLLATVLVAVPAGLVLGSVPAIERALRPLIEFLRPIPSVALIPLAGFVFSDRLDMKIAMIMYASTWPILINTMYGLKDVDPLAKETLRSFGFGHLSVLWRVSLPSAAPFIATGIRVSATIALILAISTELIGGGSDGIGAYIVLAQSSPDGLTLTVAATVWAGVLGLLTNTAFMWGERHIFHWHATRVGAAQ